MRIRHRRSVAALAAIRSHAHFRDFAQRLTRKGNAVTAVMRKLVVILSAMAQRERALETRSNRLISNTVHNKFHLFGRVGPTSEGGHDLGSI